LIIVSASILVSASSVQLRLFSGSFNSSGFDVTLTGAAGFFIDDAITSVTITGSNITCEQWEAEAGAWTFNVAGSTIGVGATGQFLGGNRTYDAVEFNGTAHTTSGNNTFNTLTLDAGTTQTVSFRDGTLNSATTFVLSGAPTSIHTLQGTGVAGWSINQSAGTVNADYINLSWSTAIGGATFNAVGGSVDGGNNVGWNFPLTISSSGSSGVAMDADGVTSATLTSNITDMGGSATVDAWWDYGIGVYDQTTANITYGTTNFTGDVAIALPTNLTPGETYQFRYSITSGTNTTNTADDALTFTMPTCSTDTATIAGSTITMSGQVLTAGVASDSYVYVEWGTTTALGNTTPLVVQAGTGTFSADIPSPSSSAELYYRGVVQNGAVVSIGATQSLAVPSAVGTVMLVNLLRLVIAASIMVTILWRGDVGVNVKTLVSTVTGILAFVIADQIITRVLL
jgi:hypothetical protein